MFPFRRRRLGLESQTVKKLTFRRQGIDCLVGVIAKLVLPSVSRASLALLGTASLLTLLGTASRVSSRGAQASRDPSANASGRQKRPLGGQLFSFISSEASPCHFERSEKSPLSQLETPRLTFRGDKREHWAPLAGARGDSTSLSSRGTQVPMDPSLRAG